MAASKPGYFVFRLVGKDKWRLIGDVNRLPGKTAREARAQAIQDATGGEVKAGERYRAVLRSEWKIAGE